MFRFAIHAAATAAMVFAVFTVSGCAVLSRGDLKRQGQSQQVTLEAVHSGADIAERAARTASEGNAAVLSAQPGTKVVVRPLEVEERVTVVEKIVEVPVYVDRKTGAQTAGACRIVRSLATVKLRVGQSVELSAADAEPGFYRVTEWLGGNYRSIYINPADRLRHCPSTGELNARGILFRVAPG